MKERSWFSYFALAFLGLALIGLVAFVWLRWPWQEPFLLGGIQVNEADHKAWVEALEAAGMNTVAVTVYLHQGDWDSDHLWESGDASAVLHEIRAARAHGLEVVLILRVALDHAFEENRFLWHGMIQPETEQQVLSWFRQYGAFVLRWARVAEDEGVGLLGIASEMNELTSTVPLEELPPLHEYYLNEEKQAAERRRILRHGEKLQERRYLRTEGGLEFDNPEALLVARSSTHRRWAEQVTGSEEAGPVPWMNRRRELLESSWRDLIADVRRIYGGRLTYAANFDQFEQVGFWDALDVMGINAYFPLRTGMEPASRPGLLEEGWQEVLVEIDELRRIRGLPDLPVVFTELGYTYREGSTIEPWASLGFSVLGPRDGGETRLVIWQDQPRDFRERALAIRALRLAAEGRTPDMVQGLLYWKLSTDASHLDIEPFVMILGKEPEDPALAELRALAAGRG